MPVPLAIAAPASLALLAYANARTSFWYDLVLLNCDISASLRLLFAQRAQRVNLFYLLESQAAKHTSSSLLWFQGNTFSYKEIYDRVLKYAAWLRNDLAVKKGDVVAMDFMNGEHFVIVWFAIWSLGAKPAFINYNLTGESLAHCLKVSSAKVCIVEPDVAPKVDDQVRADLASTMSFTVFTPDVEAQVMALDGFRVPDEDRNEDNFLNMAILIYTSGTTGLPKPAVVSWGKCYIGSGYGQKLAGRYGGDNDIIYTAMPMYHSAASILSFLATLFSGGTQALGRKFSSRTFWPDVRASRATIIQYVGETLRYLLAAPPQLDPATGASLDRQHRVRAAFGNGLSADIWNRFRDRFGVDTIVELYTATEGTFGLWNVSSNQLTAGAIGRHGWLTNFLDRRNVALVQVDWDTQEPFRDPKTGFCVQVPTSEPGELLNKLPGDDPNSRFTGYFRNPRASESKIVRNVFKKGDAYFRTGDVARWDSDGRVYFVDRIGDTFRWKSENVSTAEVSSAVGTHPAVREANVYGVALPHHDGRAGCVAVTLDHGQDQPSRDTMRSLARHVRERLPRYAQPLFLRLMREVGGQATGTMKQQKHVLRKAGVKPSTTGKTTDDVELGSVYWLVGDEYVRFEEDDWKSLEAGRVKL
ncbi:hypothetical protein S7711_04679 [Stachybotrys chartarum IBT 7711]|uniref:Very long-chain fatty acid transport protein n=1 Tax=Stachybotrys chartarum (strain CBS 109288 / IBT 7711) TaxID=1280523 RepID=A0A084B637_STACB|nr:hypothetical protein S7711_04679 [Stachybotrys chartarum IBT 7711]